MPGVEGQLPFGGNLDFAREHALGKCAARFITQCLSDAAELIYKTGHPRIGCPNHGATRFDTAKNCVRQMLLRSGGMQKPSIVCEVHQQVCASNYKLPRQIANRVFEANQRRDLRVANRQAKQVVWLARGEFGPHPLLLYRGEKRKKTWLRGEFAKRYQ